MGGIKTRMLFLAVPLILQAQTPVLIESFASSAFPPAGWDTTRSDSAMGYWVRYATSGAEPDSHHARVQVYNRYDTLRQGYSELVTRPFSLPQTAGDETLSFWFRFSTSSQNLGPEDTLRIEAGADSTAWTTLFRIGVSQQTNAWTTAAVPLSVFHGMSSVRVRFRFEDRPNGSLGTQNRYFWLDSVKVVSYGVGAGEDGAGSGAETAMLTAFPNPARDRIQFGIEPRAKSIELRIYDIKGSFIHSFALCSMPFALYWDCTDQSGRRLPSGVYCCEMRTGNRRESRLITLLR